MAKKLVGWVKYNGIYQRSSIFLDTDLFTKVWVEVFNSLGSTFNRGDFTPTNAFFWSSLDLSPYHGTDLGSTPFYIEVLDADGKKATGYLGAVGAGETLGSELLTNPSFDVDTSEWNVGGGTIASIDGGQSGKCLELTAITNPTVYEGEFGILDALYKVGYYVKSGTAGDQTYRVSHGYIGPSPSGTSSGSWVQGTIYLVKPTDGYFRIQNSLAALTMLFDEISLKRVTDPPSTGIHIVSSLNGATRNWASIESGFDPNTIASWKIYR